MKQIKRLFLIFVASSLVGSVGFTQEDDWGDEGDDINMEETLDQEEKAKEEPVVETQKKSKKKKYKKKRKKKNRKMKKKRSKRHKRNKNKQQEN